MAAEHARACRALYNNRNQPDASVEWLLSHMDDSRINEPFVPPADPTAELLLAIDTTDVRLEDMVTRHISLITNILLTAMTIVLYCEVWKTWRCSTYLRTCRHTCLHTSLHSHPYVCQSKCQHMPLHMPTRLSPHMSARMSAHMSTECAHMHIGDSNEQRRHHACHRSAKPTRSAPAVRLQTFWYL